MFSSKTTIMSTRVTRSSSRIARMWQLRFPPEVWDIVFTRLGEDEEDNHPQADLKNASLACRAFSLICERHIWREYTLQIGEKPIQSLANFLKKHPRLANHIKHVNVILIIPGVNSIRAPKASKKWLEQLPNALDQLRNVRALWIMPDERAAIDFNGYEYHLPFIDLPPRLQASLARIATAPQINSLLIRSMHYFPLEILWAPRPSPFGVLIENVECACAPALLLHEPEKPTAWKFLSMADDGMHNSLKQLFELFKRRATDGTVERVFVPVDFRNLSFLYWRIGDQHSLDTLKEVLKRVEALEMLHIEAPYFNHYHANQADQVPEFNILKSLNPLSYITLRRLWMTSMGGQSGEEFDMDSFVSELSALPGSCDIQSIALGPIPREPFNFIGQKNATASATGKASSTPMGLFWPRLGQALTPERFPSLASVVLQFEGEPASLENPDTFDFHAGDTALSERLEEAMYPRDAEGKADLQVAARRTRFSIRAFHEGILPHPQDYDNT